LVNADETIIKFLGKAFIKNNFDQASAASSLPIQPANVTIMNEMLPLKASYVAIHKLTVCILFELQLNKRRYSVLEHLDVSKSLNFCSDPSILGLHTLIYLDQKIYM
jgi:hypothetical protein